MSKPVKPIITICSSANFYRQVVDLQEQLEAAGFTVFIPHNATVMKDSGDFDVSHYKTWYKDAQDYHKKAWLMRAHFDEIAKADAILVVNHEKHGQANYIGGNVLMEMALAFHLDKPIYIMNEVPTESSFVEEILGMQPIILGGKIEKLSKAYKLGSTANA